MKRSRTVLMALALGLVLASLVPSAPVAAQTVVSGTITEDTTWTKVGSPYILSGEVVVGEVGIAVTLTIEPGVEVRGGPGSRLTINGYLKANGTEDERILFTSDSGGRDWNGISFDIVTASPPPQHELTYTTIEKATTGVKLAIGQIENTGNVFDQNDRALVFDNPTDPAVFEQNVFTNNGIAVTGRSMGSIGIYESDFWNNEVNVLPQPQKPYSCLPDEGRWDIQRNDILRGPVNEEYFSWDVHTPPGSRSSDYTVDARDNWWGTTDEERITGRTIAGSTCCPSSTAKFINVSPISQQEHTDWKPPGDVPDPEPEPFLIYDPGVFSEINAPQQRECLERESLPVLRGKLVPALSDSDHVLLSLSMVTPNGCKWWNARRSVFIKRPCSQALMFKPTRVRPRKSYGYAWSYRFPRVLPAGRYEVASTTESESDDLGRNRVQFRLL